MSKLSDIEREAARARAHARYVHDRLEREGFREEPRIAQTPGGLPRETPVENNSADLLVYGHAHGGEPRFIPLVSRVPLPGDEADVDVDLEARVSAALGAIPAGQAMLLRELYFGRRSQQELATELGVTKQAVSQRLERAKTAFVKAFGQL